MGEFPASWCADAACMRNGRDVFVAGTERRTTPWKVYGWLAHSECDVSFDGAGDVFYAHLGGGTIGAGRENDRQRRQRVAAWIEAARKALEL